MGTERFFGLTALHHAAYYDRVEAIELLLDFGADIDAVAFRDETPLMSAVDMSNVGAVEVLLKRGACSNMKNIHTQTALYRHCTCIENEKIIELLESQQDQA